MQKECADEQFISTTRARRLPQSASTSGHLFFLLQ